jgi:hypoxanthine-DNA glycosylase
MARGGLHNKPMLQNSSLDCVSDGCASVLILGSFPSIISLEKREYYANPRNDFWWIMGEITGCVPCLPYETRLSNLRRNGIALWDVCKSVDRLGSLDSKIADKTVVPNDILEFVSLHKDLRVILFNGAKAERLFQKNFTDICVPTTRLDSTSRAHTVTKLIKLERWHEALKAHIRHQ